MNTNDLNCIEQIPTIPGPYLALTIPHVLRLVIGFLPIRSRAACALVSKHWYEVAIDELWRHLKEPVVLFRMLWGVDNMPRQRYLLATEDRWGRLSFHAKRVRSLSVGTSARAWANEATFQLLSMKPMQYLLPNLTHLEWKSQLPVAHVVTFLSPKITLFSIRIVPPAVEASSTTYWETFESLLAIVSRICPFLEELKVESSHFEVILDRALADFLSKLHSLKRVYLPDRLLTASILASLAACSMLNSIKISSLSGEVLADRPDLNQSHVTEYTIFKTNGAFQSLNHLEVNTTVDAIVKLLETKAFPPSLRSLGFRLAPSDVLLQANFVFQAIGYNLPSLENLTIESYGEVPPDLTTTLPFSTLRPLMECKRLQRFTLLLPCFVETTDDQLVDLAQAWPKMTDLRIFPNFKNLPRGVTSQLASPTCLAKVAQFWPEIQRLHLVIDPSRSPPPVRTFPKWRLSCLQSLRLGFLKPENDPYELAIFIARMTTRQCGINARFVAELNPSASGSACSPLVHELVSYVRELDKHHGFT